MRGDHYIISCFLCFEVSQASYTQDESITPLFYRYVCRQSQSPTAKVGNFFQTKQFKVKYLDRQSNILRNCTAVGR